MKKVLTVMLAVIMAAVLFAGCSQTADNSSSESAAQNDESGTSASSDGASDDAVQKIKDSGKLVVLTNSQFPPYEYIGSDGNVSGIDIDISQAVADELGVELEIVDMDFDGLITALMGGKGDIVAAGMTVDPERAESVDFSDTYADATQMIIVTKDDPKVSGADDLGGKIIGVQLGTTGDLYASDEENAPGAEVKQYKGAPEAAQDLKNGKLDAVVIDQLTAENIAASNDDLVVLEIPSTDEQYAIAIAKGNNSLTEIVNQVIKQLQDSGKIAEFTEVHVEASKIQ